MVLTLSYIMTLLLCMLLYADDAIVFGTDEKDFKIT